MVSKGDRGISKKIYTRRTPFGRGNPHCIGRSCGRLREVSKQPASKSNTAKTARKKKAKKAQAVAAQAAAPSNNTLTQSEILSAGEVKEMVKVMASEVHKSQKINDACRE